MTDPAPSPVGMSPSDSSEESHASIIRRYLDVLRRRFWIILTFAIIATCFGAVRAFQAPDIYSAYTEIMVERQAHNVVSVDPSVLDFAPWDPDFYNTQAQLILSQPVLEIAVLDPMVARTLGQYSDEESASMTDRVKEVLLAALGAPPAHITKLWEKLASYVSARPKAGTHLIIITSTAQDSRTPAILADGVARAFEQYMLSSRTEKLGDAFAYLKDEKEREEEKYLAAEHELQSFREEFRDVDLGQENSPAMLKLAALNSRLTDLQLSRAELKAQLVAIPPLLASVSNRVDADITDPLLAIPILKDDPGIQAARTRMLDQKDALSDLARTYGAEHPLLIEARASMAEEEQAFNATIQQALQVHSNRLDGIMAEETELSAEYDTLKSEVIDNAQSAFKLARLEMEVDRHRQLYDALVKRMLEVEMSSGFEATTIKRLKEAAVNPHPVGPDRKMDILVALMMGLGIGIALAIIIETLDDTIKTPEDLRDRLDIPLLGFIPRIKAKTPSRKHHRIKTLFAVDEPVSSIAEAFRQIRTNLFYSLSTESAKVLVSTSCHPGEGKTTTICNLAAVIAQNGRRVLLVDGDFHRPNVHHVYGVRNTVGLVDVLGGTLPWQKAITAASRNGRVLENIDIIPAGASTAASSERLGTDAMRRFIAEARTEYDWVLVDSPPLLFVSDASVLSAMCDGIILVVKAGMNNRSLLSRTCAHLRQLKVKILGSILNQMVVSFVGRHYSYYYYHGYAHYAENYHRSYYGDLSEDEEQEVEGAAPVQLKPTPNGSTPAATHPTAATAATPAASPSAAKLGPESIASLPLPARADRPRPASATRKRNSELQSAVEKWRKESGHVAIYHMGRGDVVEIGLPPLRETDQAATLRKIIDRNGLLTLPVLGTVAAAGKTRDELRDHLATLCLEHGATREGVAVNVLEHHHAAMLVCGAVTAPAFQLMEADQLCLLEVLLEAGGPASKAARQIRISIPDLSNLAENPARHPIRQLTVEFAAPSPDPERNPLLVRGSIVRMDFESGNHIHVLGHVQNPGAIPLTDSIPATACTSLAAAGGFTHHDRTEVCHVIRESADGFRDIIPVPLQRIIYGETADIVLQPDDILVVGARAMSRFSPLPPDMAVSLPSSL